MLLLRQALNAQNHAVAKPRIRIFPSEQMNTHNLRWQAKLQSIKLLGESGRWRFA